ncbi:MAG TPA: pseudouridine synthase [Candidatus Sulfomarinibacteraceae bacterium]|nr:pseudouridine synthase [Candidatus Sulfomarinibacteraceae bacterium]
MARQEERLQKIMAKAGLGSRRANEKLIKAGRVKLNGRVATLGDKANPEIDRIEVDGEEIEFEAPIYIMLNKPRGVLSSTEDDLQQGRPTVRGMVDVPGHIYPVGRLDKTSEGLILLTNDGKLAHRLTHPRFEHEKVYDVTVTGHPSKDTLQRWRRGLMLRDKKTAPAGVEVIDQDESTTRLRITMREGRKRQIRRVAALLGHDVQRLFREKIGPLSVGDLPRGQWRRLTEKEVEALHDAVGTPPEERRRRRS